VPADQNALVKFAELRKTVLESSIDAAINTIEFSLRENNTGRFPRGIAMMLRSMGAWIYRRDPTCAILSFTLLMHRLRLQ
jgi:Zn-dependent M16 (insulinase) family peptidase